MSSIFQAIALTSLLSIIMAVLVHAGHWFGLRRAGGGEPKIRGNVVDASVFGLLSLLIAFSFNGALERYDTHRTLIADEVNAIGTTYLRIDLMPEIARPALRAEMRGYVQSRLDVYRARLDPLSEPATRSAAQREALWQHSVAACEAEDCSPATETLFFSALDEMFSFPVKQALMRNMHPPRIVFVTLFGLALLCAFLVGYDQAPLRSRTWAYAFAFPFTLTAIIWLVLDIEYPRLGINRLSALDELLRLLLQTMPD